MALATLPSPSADSGAKGQHTARSSAMAWPRGCPAHPLTEEGNRSSAQVPARTVSPIAGPTDTADQAAAQRVAAAEPPGRTFTMENVAQRKDKTGL